MRPLLSLLTASMLLACVDVQAQQRRPDSWVTFEGGEGPGRGKHIVFVTGDEEYRSEEGMTMLAKILAGRHGFRCTVLYAVDPESGEIDPEVVTNIPGLHLLDTADLMVLFVRWRELPDDQMRHIVDYTNSGRPLMGLRTATHPFAYERNKTGPYARYHWNSKEPEGGYGRLVFGETWVDHHGHHGHESTRGLVNGLLGAHPVLRGVRDVWGPTDVYTIRDLPEGSEVLLWGQVLEGMTPDAPPNVEKSLMPVAWVRNYTGETGQTARVFFTTMGASVDLESEDLRRLLVNGAYWALAMEDRIPERAAVDYVGAYEPTDFGFGQHRKGVRPADLAIEE